MTLQIWKCCLQIKGEIAERKQLITLQIWKCCLQIK